MLIEMLTKLKVVIFIETIVLLLTKNGLFTLMQIVKLACSILTFAIIKIPFYERSFVN